MMSLLLFTAVSSICFPYIYKLYQEKKTTEQLLYAINEVDLAASVYGLNQMNIEDREWTHSGTTFSLLTSKGVKDDVEICVVFKGENGKNYRRCASYH
jgi:hypothetical protein